MAKAKKAATRSAAPKATATAATSAPAAAAARPTTRPAWCNMLDQKMAPEYAAVKLRYLEKFDRPGLAGLLRREQLGSWLAKQGHQAAVLHERLERGKVTKDEIEKNVADVLTPHIEQQAPLPPTIEQELVKLLAEWKKGEGTLFPL